MFAFMKRFLKYFLGLIIILTAVAMLGPTEKFDKVDSTPIDLGVTIDEIEDYVSNKENQISNIKEDNHARILWQDSLAKTPYAIVYLHGYSASHGEGYPIIQNFSKRYNCNAYLSRLELHGLNDADAYKELTPYNWIESAKEAIAIGKTIGEKVIIMSTSTGSTLGTYLSAFDPDIVGHIMMSPNFDLYDGNSHLLTKPWGKQIMRFLSDGDYHQWEDAPDGIDRYWTTKNHIQGVIALRDLLNQTMTDEVFKAIDIPVYAGYYFKDETQKDDVVSTDAIESFAKSISTQEDQKTIVKFDNAIGHVIGCDCLNPNWEDVQNSIFEFAENVLQLKEAEASIELELTPQQ